jgi:hypothetical protein
MTDAMLVQILRNQNIIMDKIGSMPSTWKTSFSVEERIKAIKSTEALIKSVEEVQAEQKRVSEFQQAAREAALSVQITS